ncbi:MAG: fibronectin-binding protein (FBP) [Acidimicrobiaceae bacterium]|nr:fibronectin-binding protein (FBP) [Acidimicrobiaceae bacterium]
MEHWLEKLHVCKIGGLTFGSDESLDPDHAPGRDAIEPWFLALLQAEHCALLLGSGFTIGACDLIKAQAPSMAAEIDPHDTKLKAAIDSEAKRTAALVGRSAPNLEDRLRAAMAAEAGLRIVNDARASKLRASITDALQELISGVLDAERAFAGESTEDLRTAQATLSSFLMSFVRRTPTRDRLHIFTTNYDRLIEHICDFLGIRMMDRFVGAMAPRFRSSRLDIDLHYNPPGIRGEPRVLGGVVKLSKLHGSVDWVRRSDWIERIPLAFGSTAPPNADAVLVFPNSYKDYETAFFPYAELFRDFSASIVRPNSVVVTYGYGFGDDHVNRILSDMLSLPSTHLIIISYDAADGRVAEFVRGQGIEDQISVLKGSYFGDLQNLSSRLLPQPSLAEIWARRARVIRDRRDQSSNGRDDDVT